MNFEGKVFLGKRERGKTTRLFDIANRFLALGKKVLVIDSATDHEKKSILCWLKNRYPQESFIIGKCRKEEIIFPDFLSKEAFPSDEYLQAVPLYLCDASYYLERGYLFPEGNERENERLWYKKFAMQVAIRLLDKVDVILLDEIELIPESRKVIESILNRHILFYMSLHESDSIKGMEDLLTIETV